MEKFMGKYRIPSARLQNWDYANPGAYFITICTKDRIEYFGEIVNEKMIYTPIGAIADVLWSEIKNHTKNVDLGEYIVMPNHVHGIIILLPVDSKEALVDRTGMGDSQPSGMIDLMAGTGDSTPGMVDSTPGMVDSTTGMVASHVETLHATSLPRTNRNQNRHPAENHNRNQNRHPAEIPNRNQNRRTDENHNPNQNRHPAENHNNIRVENPIPSKNPNHVENRYVTQSPKSGSISAIVRSYKSAVTRHTRRLGFQFEWQTRFHDHIIRDAESFERITSYIKNNPKNWKKDKFYS